MCIMVMFMLPVQNPRISSVTQVNPGDSKWLTSLSRVNYSMITTGKSHCCRAMLPDDGFPEHMFPLI